jgi:glycerol-3-phosphate acyltransferase PlsY
MKILFVIFAYFLGSFPSGYILFRLSEKKDIRGYGSQSTGATNVLRVKGFKFALPVVIVDVIKGALPVFLAMEFFHDQTLALASAFAAVLGHCFPVYIRFRGGKGVATSMGVFALLAFKPFLVSLALFLLIIALTRFVSLGSLVSTFCFPFLALLFHQEMGLVIWGLAIFLLIFFKHWENVQRLMKGEERKLGQKVKV